jgi:hypothetical protein
MSICERLTPRIFVDFWTNEEAIMIGLGILVAIFGPLLLIPLIVIVNRAARPFMFHLFPESLSGDVRRTYEWLLSTGIVMVVMAASYLPGRLEFNRLCKEKGPPVILQRVITDGYFRTPLYPYEAGMILYQSSFTFVEGPDMYRKGVYLRYMRAKYDRTQAEKITAPTSRYGVREDFQVVKYGIQMTSKKIYILDGEHEIARATGLSYQGGPLWFFFGAYALMSYPNIAQNAQDFSTYCNLEKEVLKAPGGTKPF